MSVIAERPGPGQESVWDYPRPPRLERVERHLRVVFAGIVIAESRRPLRVLETSHPPVYYVPPGETLGEHLVPSRRGGSFCEWKGAARYLTVRAGERQAPDAAWCYPAPMAPFGELAGHIAFYPAAMDECTLDGEVVRPQPGGFYGGWITDEIVGPFKGGPGTRGW